MHTHSFTIDTGIDLVTDITDRVATFAAEVGGDGLLNVFLPHATCGVALIETGSGSEADLADVVERIVPRDDRYRHRHGPTGHGGDHLLPAFIGPSLVLPVERGRPMLGTWQSVVIVDPNREDRSRTIRLSFVTG